MILIFWHGICSIYRHNENFKRRMKMTLDEIRELTVGNVFIIPKGEGSNIGDITGYGANMITLVFEDYGEYIAYKEKYTDRHRDLGHSEITTTKEYRHLLEKELNHSKLISELKKRFG
jgi:hypothetical protein